MTPSRDFVRMARDYAKDVVAGRILACRFVKLACLRHLDGLKKQRTKAYPYKMDEAAAVKVCRFIELLPHVKGKWARDKEKIRLEPWQAFIVVNVFGWKRKKDGLRRYRRVYVEVPRKNAKSTLTAAIADYMLVADDEHGAEVYSGATTEKQAWEVFGPARLMIQQTPELIEHFGVSVGAKNLHVLATASKLEPIIGKPGDGASPSMSVTDEYHEHDTPVQYETMLTGMGAREQPLAWVITTAGSDTSGPCYTLRQQAIDTLEGKTAHDELFTVIYGIDGPVGKKGQPGYRAGDDWTSPNAIRKANPNLGVSVSEEFLRTAQLRAVSDPTEASTFKTKHLDEWVTAASPYFNAEYWARLSDAPAKAAHTGNACVKGLDLASKIDLAAEVSVFQRMVDEVAHYDVYGRFYVPEGEAAKPEKRSYAAWAADGHLTLTPGNGIDLDAIEDDVTKDADTFPIAAVGGDPWNATQLITHLQKALGEEVAIVIPQTTAHLSEPMKEIQKLINEGRIHHDGNPVMAWCIGNVTAQEDRNDNVFPRKEKAERKIDGAVALINAFSLIVRSQVFDQAGSVYETRGVRVF
jgi:phage terminase large subunit-like protein